ncbi:MAG TPA: hypothetical protein VMS21_10975 [Methylomirabilota bacterium]|nr:hypothetical protein [Methylomirabilota bacterium]
MKNRIRLRVHACASFGVWLSLLLGWTLTAAGAVHVDACASGFGNGSHLFPYKTLTQAVAEAAAGSNLSVQSAAYPERLTITKNLKLEASGGRVLIGTHAVKTAEICVPVMDHEQLPLEDPISCGSDPIGVHAKLYYPAVGPDGLSMACAGPFPLIVYAHGRRASYQALCDGSNPGPVHEDYREADGILTWLAAAGIIVISVDVSAGPTPIEKASIMMNTVSYACAESARRGSLLQGAVDPQRIGLLGHSQGGAAAIRAAACLNGNSATSLDLPKVDVLAVGLLAPALWQVESDVDGVGGAALVIYGTNDEHPLQVGDDPLEVYGSLAPPKHLVVVEGANHFGYTDGICLADDDYASTVGGLDGPAAQQLQQLTARRNIRAFFSSYLLGDSAQLDYLVQESGEQCGHPGNPPACGIPKRHFEDLENLGVNIRVCSCVP